MLKAPGRAYWVTVSLLFMGVVYGYAVIWPYQMMHGLGKAGYRPPVLWGAYLVDFVFWIGIAHSGTLISAILFLFRARFRTSISRSAEAMTIFAASVAALFPIIHLGRPWVFYWLIPYPNQRYLWPDFLSPLVFDFLAVSTYITASLLFWYTGLVPDLAAVRESAKGIRKRSTASFHSAGRGPTGSGAITGPPTCSSQPWRRLSSFPCTASFPGILPFRSYPATTVTIFAPYFVAGAIHSGLAMVLTLLIPLRRIFRLESIITTDTFEKIAKTSIAMALIVGYSYVVEPFIAWYSGSVFERQSYLGPGGGLLCTPVLGNVFLQCHRPLELLCP